MSVVKEIDMQQMGQLRNQSQKASQFLDKRLNGYLQTLTPMFAPRKVLGEFMESAFKEKVPGADKNFAELEEQFKAISREAFQLPSKLGTPVPNIKNQLEVYPWEYLYQIGGETITITSPVRWVVGYAGGYTLNDLLEQRTQGETPEPDDVKGLILRSLTLAKLMDQSPSVAKMLGDLRFKVSMETCEVSGALPFVVVTSDVPSFRPQDELIQMVTQLSGKPVFEELIDAEAIAAMEDPFRARLTELMAG